MSDIKTQLCELYQEALKYKSSVDDDQDIRFEVPGLGHLYIILDARDPEFLKLDFPYFFDNSKRKDLGEAEFCMAANQVNRSVKAAKLSVIHLQNDDTWNVSAHIEAFVAGPDQLPDLNLLKVILDRCISALQAAARKFMEEIGNLESNTSADDSTI